MNRKKNTGPADYRPFNLQLPAPMFEEAQRRAASQGISMQRFIRMGVAGMTGIPDPTRQWSPPSDSEI